MKIRSLTALLAPLLVAPISGCGTLMFEERVNAPHSDRIDPNVMILDGLGLLLFVVPGVVSYAVDFSNGSAYLPEGVQKGEGPFIED